MKGSDLVRIIDEMQHQKNIEREIIFAGIEAALQLAAEKKYGEGMGITVSIDRDTGDITAKARVKRSSTRPSPAASPPRAPRT